MYCWQNYSNSEWCSFKGMGKCSFRRPPFCEMADMKFYENQNKLSNQVIKQYYTMTTRDAFRSLQMIAGDVNAMPN